MLEMLGSRLQRQPLYAQVAQSIEKAIADGRSTKRFRAKRSWRQTSA